MKYFLKRVIGTIPVLLGVVLLIFVMLRIIPGSPVLMLLGEHYDQATIDRLTAAMGLDRPMIVQFVDYITGALSGDLGISYKYSRPVTDMIMESLPYTIRLAVMAALFAWIMGLVTGVIAAVKKNNIIDRLFMGISLLGVSMPIFMTSLVLQYIFSFKLEILPMTEDGTFLSMILPSIALGWNSAGSIARMTRSSLIEVMQADYIDTARAKGLLRGAVIIKHALKNSLLPVVTMMALQLSSMLSGAVITESVFAIPGIGRLATTAIQNRDMPVLQGTVLFTTVIVIAGNLLADLLYSVLDPRIRKGD
ncbi:MAG TPA: ABC transporter permease [Candidatus Avilachnospira avicola]|nr:ABC transporter permease [Candidatus Avilachnospira avicola]